jgi:hypothetical protein
MHESFRQQHLKLMVLVQVLILILYLLIFLCQEFYLFCTVEMTDVLVGCKLLTLADFWIQMNLKAVCRWSAAPEL